MPPRDCRVITCRCETIRSTARGSSPITSGARAAITPESPALPKLSLNSDQPITPSLVVSLRNENMRQPASHCRVSIPVTFMGVLPLDRANEARVIRPGKQATLAGHDGVALVV